MIKDYVKICRIQSSNGNVLLDSAPFASAPIKTSKLVKNFKLVLRSPFTTILKGIILISLPIKAKKQEFFYSFGATIFSKILVYDLGIRIYTCILFIL